MESTQLSQNQLADPNQAELIAMLPKLRESAHNMGERYTSFGQVDLLKMATQENAKFRAYSKMCRLIREIEKLEKRCTSSVR